MQKKVPNDNKHPSGVYLVAFAQFWERFSFYGILGLLALYLTSPTANGGLGWPSEQVVKIVGYYGAACFISPAFGGWIASRYLGDRSCIIYGSSIVIVGHILLSLQAWPALSGSAHFSIFVSSLCLIALGTGLLKPATSSIVGRLYADDDPRRDSGFTIFMVGVYGGSFLANFVAGTLGEKVGWHYGFGAAAIGMALGFAVFMTYAGKTLGEIGLTPDSRSRNETSSAHHEYPYPLLQILTFSLLTALYTSFFFQDAGLLNLFVESDVDRNLMGFEIPATWFLSISVTAFIGFSPIVTILWKKTSLSVHGKQSIGLLLMSIAYFILWSVVESNDPTTLISPIWFVLAYGFFGIADLHIWPVQLNAVTKLAPRNQVSFMVGVWWVAGGVGIFLTGYIAALSSSVGGTENLLLVISSLSLIGAMLAFLANRFFGKVEGVSARQSTTC